MTDREKQLRNEIEERFKGEFLAGHAREYQAYEASRWHAEDAVTTFDREHGVVSIVFVRKGAEHMSFILKAEEFAAQRWAELQMWLKHGQYVGENWIAHLTALWGGEFDRILEGPHGREIINRAAIGYVEALGWHLGLDHQVHQVGGVTLLGGEEPPQQPFTEPEPAPEPTISALLQDLLERVEALEQRLGV